MHSHAQPFPGSCSATTLASTRKRHVRRRAARLGHPRALTPPLAQGRGSPRRSRASLRTASARRSGPSRASSSSVQASIASRLEPPASTASRIQPSEAPSLSERRIACASRVWRWPWRSGAGPQNRSRRRDRPLGRARSWQRPVPCEPNPRGCPGWCSPLLPAVVVGWGELLVVPVAAAVGPAGADGGVAEWGSEKFRS